MCGPGVSGKCSGHDEIRQDEALPSISQTFTPPSETVATLRRKADIGSGAGILARLGKNYGVDSKPLAKMVSEISLISAGVSAVFQIRMRATAPGADSMLLVVSSS